MKWILIAFLVGRGGYDGSSAVSAEFHNERECRAAVAQLKQEADTSRLTTVAVCVAKGQQP